MKTKDKPIGYVTGLKWPAKQLHGKTVYVAMGPVLGNVLMGKPGKFSAKAHKDGMVLKIVMTKNGKRTPSPVTQSRADTIRQTEQGDFEIF